MEIAINNSFTNGEIVITNKKLAAATNKIVMAATDCKKKFVVIGNLLNDIKTQKLYEQDFTDGNGKGSFALYCESVLGISKTVAYRIIATSNKLLVPELTGEHKDEVFFLDFSDTALATVNEKGGATYKACKDFCLRNGITNETTVKDIKQAAKAEESGEDAAKAEKSGEDETEEGNAEVVSAEIKKKPSKGELQEDLLLLVEYLKTNTRLEDLPEEIKQVVYKYAYETN